MQTRKLNQESALHESAQEFGGEQHIDLFAVSAQVTQAADIDVDVTLTDPSGYTGEDFHIPQAEQVELLTALRGDDERAAREAGDVLYTWYRDRGIYEAERYLLSRQDAEDVYGDVWLAIWAKRESLSVKGRFWMFLKQCIMNRVRNIVRQRKVRQTDAMDMTDPEAVEEVTTDSFTSESPETWTLAREKDAAVVDAVSRLKPIEQDALRLQSEEVSIADIAAAIGKTPNRVKSLLSNAKKKVRADLSERYPDIFGEDAE